MTESPTKPDNKADRPIHGRWTAPTRHHSPLEDAQAILTGTVLCALGVAFLTSANLLTNGVAGLALIIREGLGVNFGLAFFLINIPFYALAFLRMGLPFTVKTFLAVTSMSVMTTIQPDLFAIEGANRAAAAIVAGLLIGAGLLIMFRHRTTLGGIGILALFLEEKMGIRTAYTLYGTDLIILALAFAVADWKTVLYSILGAAVLNGVLAINHRTDRYIAK